MKHLTSPSIHKHDRACTFFRDVGCSCNCGCHMGHTGGDAVAGVAAVVVVTTVAANAGLAIDT
eukprot:13479362-Alexandrium_andersonii.AAC.1